MVNLRCSVARLTPNHLQLRGVLGQLTELRADLLQRRGVNIATPEKGDDTFEEDGEDSSEDDVDETAENQKENDEAGERSVKGSRKRPREDSGGDLWPELERGFNASLPFWHSTVDTWQRRAQLGGAAANKRSFKVVTITAIYDSTVCDPTSFFVLNPNPWYLSALYELRW